MYRPALWKHDYGSVLYNGCEPLGGAQGSEVGSCPEEGESKKKPELAAVPPAAPLFDYFR